MKKLLNKEKEISYSKFRKLGYTGNFDDFSYEINKLILMSKELDTPSLDIAGGKSCQRSKFLSGGLGVLTALSAGGFDTAMANKLPDNISSHTKQRGILNKVDRDTSIALSAGAIVGLIVGGLGTAAVITKFKDEPAVSLSGENLKNFTTINCLCSDEIFTEKLTNEIKKRVFLEFVRKFIEYSKITLQNISINELFTDCTTYELTIDNIKTNYNHINEKLRPFTKKEINKNAFLGCYNLYVSAYQLRLKEIKLTNDLKQEQEKTNKLQNNYKEMDQQKTDEIEKVQKELEQERTKNNELQNEYNTMKDQTTEEIEKVQEKLKQKKEENTDLQNTVNELNQQQIELNNQITATTLRLQGVSDELQKNKEQYGIVTEQNNELIEENENLKVQLETLGEQLNNLNKTNLVKDERYSLLEQQNKILTEEARLLRNENNALKRPSSGEKEELVKQASKDERLQKRLIALVRNYIIMLRYEDDLLETYGTADQSNDKLETYGTADQSNEELETYGKADQSNEEKKKKTGAAFNEEINHFDDVLDMMEKLQKAYTQNLEFQKLAWMKQEGTDKESAGKENDTNKKIVYAINCANYELAEEYLMGRVQEFHQLMDNLLSLLMSGIKNAWTNDAGSPTSFVNTAENMFNKIIDIINIDSDKEDALMKPNIKIFLLRVVRRTIQKAIPTAIQEKIYEALNLEKANRKLDKSNNKSLKLYTTADYHLAKQSVETYLSKPQSE